MTMVCGASFAQVTQTLYVSGQFPPGHVYAEADLKSLIGHPLANPSYLVGRFVFLGERNGLDVFSTFTQGLLKSDDIAFGQTLLAVRFFKNVPPNVFVSAPQARRRTRRLRIFDDQPVYPAAWLLDQ